MPFTVSVPIFRSVLYGTPCIYVPTDRAAEGRTVASTDATSLAAASSKFASTPDLRLGLKLRSRDSPLALPPVAMISWKDKVAAKLSRLLADSPSSPSSASADYSPVASSEPEVVPLDLFLDFRFIEAIRSVLVKVRCSRCTLLWVYPIGSVLVGVRLHIPLESHLVCVYSCSASFLICFVRRPLFAGINFLEV